MSHPSSSSRHAHRRHYEDNAFNNHFDQRSNNSGASNRRKRQRKRKWIDVVSDELIVEISPHSQSSSSSPWSSSSSASSSSASLTPNSTTQEEEFLTQENVEHALMKFSKPNRVRILTTSQKAIASYWTVEHAEYVLQKTNGYLRIGGHDYTLRFNDGKPGHRVDEEGANHNQANHDKEDEVEYERDGGMYRGGYSVSSAGKDQPEAPRADGFSGAWNPKIDYELISAKKRRKEERKDQQMYPQLFDSNPGAYILDATSGLYYDNELDYYYDVNQNHYLRRRSGTNGCAIDSQTLVFTYDQAVGTWNQSPAARSTEPTEDSNENPNENPNEESTVPSTEEGGEEEQRTKEQHPIAFVKSSTTQKNDLPIHIDLKTSLKGSKNHKKSNNKTNSMKNNAASLLFQPSTSVAPSSRKDPSVVPVRPPPVPASTTTLPPTKTITTTTNRSQKKKLISLWTSRQQEDTDWNKMGCQYPPPLDFLYNNTAMTCCNQEQAWLCLLCKRKFIQEDALASHVQRSKLHKKNVGLVGIKTNASTGAHSNLPVFSMRPMVQSKVVSASSASSSSTSSSSSSSFFSSSSSMKKKKKKTMMQQLRKATTTTVAKARVVVASTSVPMNMSTNIGALLLKRMGWKEGEPLGNNSSNNPGLTAPLDAVRQLGGRLGGRGGKERLGLGHVHSNGGSGDASSVDLSDVLARQRAKQRKRSRRGGRGGRGGSRGSRGRGRGTQIF